MSMTESVNISNTAAIHEMHGHGSPAEQDSWLRNAEASASLLIALGSLLSMLATHGVLPEGVVGSWIEECLVPFQIPVFYFCLGYLYQRYTTARTRANWGLNLRRELLVMGIPFVSFTVLGLLTNSIVGDAPRLSAFSLVDALFIHPIDPVGYFYTCILIYAITPTLASRRNANGLVAFALAVKAAIVAIDSLPATAAFAHMLPYAITSVAANWVWVAAGMALALYRALPLLRGADKAWALGALWASASIITYAAGWIGEPAHAVLDALGVLWFASLFSTVFREGRTNRFFAFITRYTMAIWLFHILCLKLYFWSLASLGITAAAIPWVAAAGAVIACYDVPVALMWLLSHAGWAGAAVYPARYLPPPPASLRKKRRR